ncbi:unnamed protein product [Cylindrotheca closterium]|uniref:Kinesin light chain n=1 Tax=Cylindrotheca closterium TaxID=2856 RepID=A0AAD2FMQ4_9STRA|nr:unnamed protein product [Cylindrotheca closterium]
MLVKPHRKAKEILEEILVRQTHACGEDYPSVARTLNEIGIALQHDRNFEEALEKYNRALGIQLKILGGKHVDTADTYDNIGKVFLEQDKFEEAEEMFRKALDIKLEILPEDKISELTDLYQNLGLSLKMQDKFSEATKIQKRSLSKLVEIHGEYHYSVAKAYIGVAGLLGDQNRMEDALQLLDKSVEICNRLQGLGHRDANVLPLALYMKASYMEELGKFEGATEVLLTLLILHKETLEVKCTP